jgi:DNA-binding LacI/PurR family transcriptional regulator
MRVKSKRATIVDVAKEAGVSVSTVSHVFSEKRPIGNAVKYRVLGISERLNYRPNHSAQSLARKKTMKIGVLLRDMIDQYASATIQAIEESVEKAGYNLLLGLAGDSEKKASDYINSWLGGMVDGIILDTYAGGQELVNQILEEDFPVSTPRAGGGVYDKIRGTVLQIDDSANRMLEYLYELGHREFGVLWYRGGYYSLLHKFLTDKGLYRGKEREISEIRTMEEAENAATELLRRCPEITTLLCYNDTQAIGAVKAAKRLGIKMPEELSITGVGGLKLGEISTPSITTIKYPLEEMCDFAVQKVINKINLLPLLPVRTFRTELIIRESTGKAPVNT